MILVRNTPGRAWHARALLALASGLVGPAPAWAASLERVNDWGANGVPTTVSMYIYVPDNVAPTPPILVLAHYCGGTASAVFGQAQGGGLVAAADQYGFIMVVPQAANSDGSGRCWDVGSNQALTRDGGGDTEAILQMVQHTVTQYGANADRVYVTGDSSGGMMTEALLALYPDVFKGGAAMAGVPAGCWAVSNPDGSWSGPCAGGSVTHTGAEWGDIVDAMYPGYTGHRPRVQLFHGDADDIISYTNHTEAIKQWTQVLGLSETPTSTETVQLGNHQATRQRWENACGYVVLDAFKSMGGDHGPSDALFLDEYVVPFLGLDQTGAVDPEVEQCDTTMGGTGGAASTTDGTTQAVATAAGGTTTDSGSTGATLTGTGTTSAGLSTGSSLTTSSSSTGATSSVTSTTAGVTTSGATASTTAGGTSSVSATMTTGSLDPGATTEGSQPTPEADGCGCRVAGARSSSFPLGAGAAFGLMFLGPLRRWRASRRKR